MLISFKHVIEQEQKIIQQQIAYEKHGTNPVFVYAFLLTKYAGNYKILLGYNIFPICNPVLN